MISRYLEYKKPEIEKEILSPRENTIIVFSRLTKPIELNKFAVEKLSLVFSFIQEALGDCEDENQYNEEKEVLYGTLVDCFEEEGYFVSDLNNDVKHRELKVVELETMPSEETEFGSTYSDETLIAFGFLNSKDIYLTPNDLKLLKEDLTWFVNESNRCSDETAKMVNEKLINNINLELELIDSNAPHANIFVKGL